MVRSTWMTAGLAVLLTATTWFTLPVDGAGATTAADLTLVSHAASDPTRAAAGYSASPAVSANGAYVAFLSRATDLVAGQSDSNGADDVFLFERHTGKVTLVSRALGNETTTANGFNASTPTISDDGAFVAFDSSATNLVAGQDDANSSVDTFLFERATGMVTLVSHSVSSHSTTADGFSEAPSISGDGAFVTFQSVAIDLVSGQTDTNDNVDVFLWERSTGAVSLVSRATGVATTGNDISTAATISANGNFVTFESGATNLVLNQSDTPHSTDVLQFERTTGARTLVSHRHNLATATTGANSHSARISADGGFVAFYSTGTNFVAGQIDGGGTPTDVFLYDRATAVLVLVSHTAAKATSAAGGTFPSISANGAFVLFGSTATNVVAGQVDSNGSTDVFLFSRTTGVVTLVSHTPDNTTGAGNLLSKPGSVSGDGAFATFASAATNLVTGQDDTNGQLDVFMFERTSGAVSLSFHLPGSESITVNRASYSPSVTADGSFAVFTTDVGLTRFAGQPDYAA